MQQQHLLPDISTSFSRALLKEMPSIKPMAKLQAQH
jgi:hypothetical protein